LSDESELRDMMGFKNNQAMFDRAMALFTTKDGWKSKWGSELLLSLGDENGKYVRLVVKLLQDNPNVLAGDLEPVEQWGKGSDGRLVLLDVGGDNEMMKRFYNR
jgi:hypothetical protein